MSIVFFDVDNTLMKGFSGFYTTLLLMKRGVIKKRRLPAALLYRLIGPLRKTNLKKIYEIAMCDMAGWPLKDILEIGRECFERSIKPRLYVEAIREIQRHKMAGRPVYLITSGPYMTIKILADFLGVNGDYSAGPVIDAQGILMREIRTPICYREGKVEVAEKILCQHQASWKESYFYGDSIDDTFLLGKVGHPVMVNPDKRLARIGKKLNWPVLHFTQLMASQD